MKSIVSFIGVCELKLSHEKGAPQSKHEETNIRLELSDNLDKKMYHDEEYNLTKEGVKVLTMALVQGLVANIHYANQKGIRRDVEHLEEVIKQITDGFARNATVEKGEMKY